MVVKYESNYSYRLYRISLFRPQTSHDVVTSKRWSDREPRNATTNTWIHSMDANQETGSVVTAYGRDKTNKTRDF